MRPRVALLERVWVLYLAVFLFAPKLLVADPLKNWTWRNPLPQGNDLEGVTYANGRFFAVGDLGTILVSSNGTDWSLSQSGVPNHLYSLAYGNGVYAAVGSSSIVVSTNGDNWENVPSATSNTLFSVTFGKGVFVAVGGQGTILTSTNGRD